MTYKDELIRAMAYLAEKKNVKFIGQQIVYSGNPMSSTLVNVSKSDMIETPVFEETQMGMSLGYAMTGNTVVTIYPRWDFLISATNQLVNHVDKYELMTGKSANVIVRVGKGADEPLDPGHQHKGDYFDQYSQLCTNTIFHKLDSVNKIYDTYINAYKTGGVHVIAEYPELYAMEI